MSLMGSGRRSNQLFLRSGSDKVARKTTVAMGLDNPVEHIDYMIEDAPEKMSRSSPLHAKADPPALPASLKK